MYKKVFAVIVLGIVLSVGIGIDVRNLRHGLYFTLLQAEHQASFIAPVALGDITFRDVEGKPYRLSDRKEDIIILAFWASWCGFCAEEFPKMDKWYPSLAGSSIALVPVNSSPRDTVSAMQQFYAQHALVSLPLYIDDTRQMAHALQVKGYPAFFIVNKKREAIARFRPEWPDASIKTLLEYYRRI